MSRPTLFRLQGRLCVSAPLFNSWDGFEVFFDHLAENFGAEILARQDGVWQRNWLLSIDDVELELTCYDGEVELCALGTSGEPLMNRVLASLSRLESDA